MDDDASVQTQSLQPLRSVRFPKTALINNDECLGSKPPSERAEQQLSSTPIPLTNGVNMLENLDSNDRTSNRHNGAETASIEGRPIKEPAEVVTKLQASGHAQLILTDGAMESAPEDRTITRRNSYLSLVGYAISESSLESVTCMNDCIPRPPCLWLLLVVEVLLLGLLVISLITFGRTGEDF
ncbi:hypothetical protein H2198_000512 [Neophaeococcomyces mojaviensis]|uniref:Uncharacterized protein n=1 Tax=Neophaeococcomyces mojaviensis TaxID=3383035 RepID=A0ACC3AK99_9EURO|nr:hypothetical protein H2198_000512 [Knufia sp. JES_112]